MTASSDNFVNVTLELRPRLYAMLKRMVGDKTDAEDAVQETYARVLRMSARGSFDVDSPQALVTSVARRVAIDLMRKKRAVPPVHYLLQEAASAEHAVKTPDEEITSAQLMDQLAHAVERLPLRSRQVFTLSRVYEWSADEIAKRLGLSRNAVERRLAEGLFTVRQHVSRIDGKGPAPAGKLYDVSKEIVAPSSKIIVDVAPKIVVASAALAERLRREPQSVYDLAPRQFELLIAELLEDLGYRVDVTRATRDGGKDLLAYLETELGTFLCLVEAKRYRRDRKVGVELVRALYGTLNDSEANSAMLITTSSFTSDAQEFQRRHQYRLALKDYGDLMGWIRRYRRQPN